MRPPTGPSGIIPHIWSIKVTVYVRERARRILRLPILKVTAGDGAFRLGDENLTPNETGEALILERPTEP